MKSLRSELAWEREINFVLIALDPPPLGSPYGCYVRKFFYGVSTAELQNSTYF